MRRVLGPWLVLLTGCASYTPEPLHPPDLLAALEALRPEQVQPATVAAITTAPFDAGDGLSLREACAVAVRLNPRLRALRAQLGVSRAQLVTAGLLQDPVIGWGAMEVLAGLADGEVENPAWLSGFSLSWQVPRPDELDAREAGAAAGIEGSGARLAQAEWALVREVHLGYLRLLVARARRAQLTRLSALAARTRDYFAGARRNGAATAIEEGLAQVEAQGVEADVLEAELQETLARQGLNQLLGLPPDVPWTASDPLDALTAASPLAARDPADLVPAAVGRRPDVAAAQAAYLVAEAQLRLAVAQQWPRVSIGTSLSLSLPIFSRWNGPAIQVARLRRRAARAQATAAVHRVRADVHLAHARLDQARRVLELYEARLGPLVEETLRLTERAFQAREVTPLEILTAQRQVLDTQRRLLAAREAWAAARVGLESACGALLPQAQTPIPHAPAEEAP